MRGQPWGAKALSSGPFGEARCNGGTTSYYKSPTGASLGRDRVVSDQKAEEAQSASEHMLASGRSCMATLRGSQTLQCTMMHI
jgi:hypothetical protein